MEIPVSIWEAVSIDFIIGLPARKGKSVIAVAVDRLSKYCHLRVLTEGYTASDVAEFFLQQVVRLHGVPKSVVSDHDKLFISKFGKELMARSGTKLKMYVVDISSRNR